MAFDAHMEDFQRMGLSHLSAGGGSNRFAEARAYADFGRRFDRDGDALASSDADRAFHLVARATDLIDYRLPFSAEEDARRIIGEARRLLEEAVGMDPSCHDARRMLDAADSPSFDAHYHFLVATEREVAATAERAARAAEGREGASARLARDLAWRPYLRWLAAEAAQALVCGRYRACVEVSGRLMAADAEGVADSWRTLALALAKLEEEAALEALVRSRGGVAADPWLALATLALAHRSRDLARASRVVGDLIAGWPHAGRTLSRQDDLPDGAFARPVVEPRGEDELAIATSEAAVLLQEGRDREGRGTLGTWLAREPQVVEAARRDEAEGDGGAGPAGDKAGGGR